MHDACSSIDPATAAAAAAAASLPLLLYVATTCTTLPQAHTRTCLHNLNQGQQCHLLET